MHEWHIHAVVTPAKETLKDMFDNILMAKEKPTGIACVMQGEKLRRMKKIYYP
jgi:hypothetical protein